MSCSIIGEFRIGEDIVVALDATTGAPGDVTAITAKMRRADVSGVRPVFVPGAAAIEMSVTSRAASGADPAGWNIALTAAASAELEAGSYGIDAKLTYPGAIEITDQTAVILVTEAALA